MPAKGKNLLFSINSPEDLRKLSPDDLPEVSRELRQFIIDVVSSNPGHFASSLGVVELTVALHYAYRTPYDLLVWDVGHQAYGHKILTGRRDRFHTNRQYGGISGFPSREESVYDTFGVGHSSTSISAALGMAVAAKRKKEDRKVVAVIGDGALTAGLAFEGLNNAGAQNADILVILNDNRMSIDPNVGALKEYLLDITTSSTYNKVKDEVWNLLGKISKIAPKSRSLAQQIEHALKTTLLHHSNLFESLNFRYFGPVDGHDPVYLASLFKDLQKIQGPKLLHVITKKGKGFPSAENNATLFHAPPGRFDKESGEIFLMPKPSPAPPKYQEVFGETMVELAKQNDRIVAITPAMPTGSRLNNMIDEVGDRTFDVGIAEQHAVTSMGPLAKEGFKPVVAIYSTFLQRGYDQVIHDIALMDLGVTFAIDRAGIVGEDGETHQGAFDISYLRPIPKLTLLAPYNETSLRKALRFAVDFGHPLALRYPRGAFLAEDGPVPDYEWGRAHLLREGEEILFVGYGNGVGRALRTAESLEELRPGILDLRFVKPLDEALLRELAARYPRWYVFSDGARMGGVASAIEEFFAQEGIDGVRLTSFEYDDAFIPHGKTVEVERHLGLLPEQLAERVKNEK